MDMTWEQFEDCLYTAKEATLQSIAVWPEPTSHEDAFKMFIEKLTELLSEEAA